MEIQLSTALISAAVSLITAAITAILTSRKEIKKLKVAHDYELLEKERAAFVDFVSSVSKFASNDCLNYYADAIKAVASFRSFCSGRSAELLDQLTPMIKRHAGNGEQISLLLRRIVEEYGKTGDHCDTKKKKN